MSREIKFRAKRLNNNEFVTGYYLPMVDESRHFIYLPLDYLNEHSRIEIDPKTLGQYTGLLNKNGKKIFEGDIVKARNVGLCEVVFEYGAFYLSSPSFAGLLLLHYHVLDCEVIGNVYEHKYLLKEGE